jgi:hypothetical protein
VSGPDSVLSAEMREEMIRAAVTAFDLCGSMVQAIESVGRDAGMSRTAIDAVRPGVFREAWARIEASRPPDPPAKVRR